MKVIEHRKPATFWRQWRAARGRHPNYYTFNGKRRGYRSGVGALVPYVAERRLS